MSGFTVLGLDPMGLMLVLTLSDLRGDSAPVVHFHLYVYPCLVNASEI